MQHMNAAVILIQNIIYTLVKQLSGALDLLGVSSECMLTHNLYATNLNAEVAIL